MVSPFSIEEILRDAAADAVLPRRQAGSSPQSLAVTLLADYTLRTRSWLPSAALVALLAESGVTTAGARTAISRLARRGVLDSGRHGRHSSYRLTRPAADNLAHGGGRIARFAAEAESWDGWWTLVAFSLPQEATAERRALRGQLRWLGYAPLYDGLWVSPHELDDTSRAALSTVALGATSVFRARQVDIEAAGNRAPIDAWDTAGLARQYDAFIRHWTALLPHVRAGDVTGAAAVRARTEVMDAYRRFPTLDPLLPAEVMPAGLPRHDARAAFVAVYDGLAEPAQDHVRAVAERYAAGARVDIRAHTVADLGTLAPTEQGTDR
ncbi:PaaX family transcriptional regulator [Micromonospora rosaria]|uniref:PaaX family transcriptional regulator n=1 Tax=Micromonospora rosaria TaxID=47874 RepID=A0A136PZB5_9ACTN|nr:PaaX family transcriptional regulator C-terminal domain-containing protein [Micromonospora rosaria]KXK63785.1 PaaX family transcriptional regulator [Micromonospora rosaria]